MRKTGTIAGIVLALTVMVAVLGCGGGGESGATPKQVVEQFMDASLNKDVDTVYSLLSEQDKEIISLEDLRAEAEFEPEGLEYSYTIGEEEIEGDEASVEITLIVEDSESGETEEVPQTIRLIRENGEWKIYFGDSL